MLKVEKEKLRASRAKMEHAMAPVVHELPGELLHRLASYIIIMEGFHNFLTTKLVVVAGSLFFMVECWAICKHDDRGSNKRSW